MRSISGELGENLIKATSASEALEQLLKNDIAVVLMDVSMPDIDGFRTGGDDPPASPLSEDGHHLHFRGAPDRRRPAKGYQRGAVDYISVPVIPELLRAKVSVFAELHRKTQQLETLNRELEQRVAERTEELESGRRPCRS